MLKFLVDESSGKVLADALKNSGHDITYAGDSLIGMRDEDLLKLAQSERRILITNDKDFGELVFRQRKPSAGVILLRPKDDAPAARVSSILKVIGKMGPKLNRSFIVVSEDKFRIKRI